MSGESVDLVLLRRAYEQARDELLAERTAGGYWVGELSSSALSTATAVSAIAVVRRSVGWDKAAAAAGPPDASPGMVGRRELRSLVPPYDLDDLIARGAAYLVKQQNADGGFGDTDLSHSNIATTMLVVAALHLAGVADEHAELLGRANAYIDSQGQMAGLRERYGIDKTFVVPIMMNLALAGLVEWHEIDPLPFELACVPQALYRFVGMPVVSYAIPALVAIGQAQFHHARPRNPLSRLVRWLSISRSLKVLRRMQPDSGGYLEATPLTSFVVMSLASCSPRLRRGIPATESRATADEVIREGVKFLANSIRPDGSWPIDTNLATWNTTLAINALAGAGEDVAELLGPKCLDWLLSCQHTKRHPFTGADPGGFGWSDLSGAVPDADDTPGAVIALCSWRQSLDESDARCAAIEKAVTLASLWLLELRNRDGGWPTFCRGWGRLPFDRSGADLTAHAVRVGPYLEEEVDYGEALEWLRYIKSHQHLDGFWSPLWFGNQDRPDEDNPVYGTAKVLMAYRDLDLMDSPEAKRGVAWLVTNQNADGGWGSGVWEKARQLSKSGNELNPKSKIQNLKSSVEETALAVESLLAAPSSQPPAPSPAAHAVQRGLAWLIDRVERGEHRQPAPIGFYFAKLWYYERLYPLTFTVAALGRACRQFACPAPALAAAVPTDSPTS